MGFITKAQVKKAISLGTLNPKIIDDFFHDIKFRSYAYDYVIQDQLIDIYTMKANFKTDVFTHTDTIMDGVRDGYRDKVSICQLDKSIVQYAKRKSFRHYSFYNKPLTQDAMMQRRDLFKYGILTFINGVLDLDFKVQPRDDKTFLLFPYTNYDTIVDDTFTISTVLIPESVIAVSRPMTIADLNGRRRIKDQVFENTNTAYFKECRGFMCFFIKNYSNARPLFYTNITYDPEISCFIFNDMPASIDGYYMVIVGMETFDSAITVSGSATHFSIPKHNMPIPKNNLIIMVQDNNGYSYHINTDEITITECYPNVYKVDNPTRKSFKVIVLYSNKSANELLEYDTEIDYYLNTVDLLDRYKQNNVPDILRDYKPIPWDYLIRDYEDTIGISTPTDDPWYPFLYKLKKISSIYKLWCLFFQTYLRRTYGFLENWILDVSTIDLDERLRDSTLPEFPMSSEYYRPFVKPMYLFKYKNYSSYDTTTPYAWFVDGIFVVPSYVVSYEGFQYVYFDAELIKEDSLIEIERYDGNEWHRAIKVTDKYEAKVTWLERPTLMNTIFLTKVDGTYLNSGEYTVYVQDPANLGDTWFETNLNTSVFILENGMNIRIVANATDYQNANIMIHCNNKATVWDINTTNLPNFEGCNLNKTGQIDRTKQNILSRIRIYNPEGRLYPRRAYIQYDHPNVDTPPNFEIFTDTSKGNPFKVEYMGYDERIIYEQDEIPENGLINLEGKIDHPFSLVYHTVFLNGYKLNEKNIEIISPFTIAIQNVHTVKDLVIYERIHGEELFKFLTDGSETSTYIADTLLDEDPDYYQQILDNLSDIVIDPSIHDMDDDINMMLALIKNELAIKFINMDDIHTPEEYDVYQEIFEDSWRILLNADDRVRYGLHPNNWFYMSHDLNILYNHK